MNAGIYKLIFSKRLNALVVVGEICSSQGKAPGTTRVTKRSGPGLVQLVRILGIFSSGVLLVSSAWAAPAINALPTGGQVAQGSASINQHGAQMDINQASQRAVINWQSFDVGANAKVHIVQPDQAAVLLNRVVTNKPSEIYGKIDANGQVILVNNNGIVFGQDGSASASSFTASTLDINDQDFMAGKNNFTSKGSQGEIVNHGTIEAKNGGYIALLGAKISNDGKIITHNGTVAMAAADSIAIPVTASGKIKIELSTASVNAAVENIKNGVIVTEGGDVYLQAAAANNAMASVKNAGQIDTSGEQAGKAILLADNGEIKVDGAITANSNNTANKGGDIIIGRDQTTGKLAKSTDVTGARLTTNRGFIETSGDHLSTDGVSIQAGQWLLDPNDITISSSNDSNVTGVSPADITPTGGAGTTSVVKVDTIQNAINVGTNVTIKTTNASNTTGAGNITIDNALTFANNSNTDATLSLIADNGITQNAAITTTSVAGKTGLVNISMTANGNYQGNTAASANSKGITLNAGINTKGTITLTGTNQSAASSGAGAGVYINGQTIAAGTGDVNITGTASNGSGVYTINATTISGNNITISGTANTTTSGTGVTLNRNSTTNINATNNLSITGIVTGSGTGSGVSTSGFNVGTGILMTAGGTATIKGIQRGNASNTSDTLYLSGFRVNATGNVTMQAEAANSNSLAINMNREAGSLNGYNDGWRMQVRSTNGNVLIQSNQGAVVGGDINGGVNISGVNVILDNTGAGMTINGVANANGGSIDTSTGAITLGSGTSSYSGTVGNPWANGNVRWVPLGVSLSGQSSTSSVTATGNLSIGGSSSVTKGVVVGSGVSVGGNINIAGRSGAASTNGLDVTAALTAGGNINLTGESTNATPGVGVNIGAEVKTTAGTSSTSITSTSGAVSGTGNITTLAGNTGSITVNTALEGTLSGVISGGGALVKQGAGTTILTGNNTYTGTTTISAGTLQIGNAGTTGTLGTGGAVTLSTNTNLNYVRSATTSIANAISGSGNVNATITGAASNLTVDNTISLTNGNINLVTDGNLTVNKSVNTTDNTTSAIFLEAGKSTNAGTKTGGDISIVTTGGMTGSVTAANGRTTFMTGSIAGSTGLDIATGNNRYNSDEVATNYTAALGTTGKYAIYREAPNVDVTAYSVAAGVLTYSGLAQTGTQGVSFSALQNGDTTAVAFNNSGLQYAYNANATSPKNAGTYTVSASGLSSTLGYAITYKTGSLVIDKAKLTAVSGSKTYDGQTATLVAGNNGTLTLTGVNNESASLDTNKSVNLTSPNAGTKAVSSLANNASFTAVNNSGFDLSNYDVTDGAVQALANVNPSFNNVAISKANLTAIAGSKTYDGQTAILVAGNNGALTLTGVNNESASLDNNKSVNLTSPNAGTKAVSSLGNATFTSTNNSFDLNNYVSTDAAMQALASANPSSNNVAIAQAKLSDVIGSKTYNGNTNLIGGSLTFKGVNNEEFTTDLASVSIVSKDVKDNASNKVNNLSSLSLIGKNSTTSELASNYDLTQSPTGTDKVTIAQAKLTDVIGSKTYNGNTNLIGGSLTLKGVNDEEFTTDLASVSIASKDFKDNSTNKVNNLSSLSLTGKNSTTSELASNYDLTQSPTGTDKVTIDKAMLIAISGAKTYDGTTTLTAGTTGSSLRFAGITVGNATESADIASGSVTIDGKNVANNGLNFVKSIGNNLIVANGSSLDLNNYDLSSVPVQGVNSNNVTIAQKALTAELTQTVEKTYDGTTSVTNLTSTHFSVVGWVKGEGATVTKKTATYALPDVAANPGNGLVSTVLSAADYSANSVTDLSNYILPSIVTGYVGKINSAAKPSDIINPVSPITPISPSGQGGGRVMIVSAAATQPVGSFNTAGVECSIESPEACECEETLMPGTLVCFISDEKHF